MMQSKTKYVPTWKSSQYGVECQAESLYLMGCLQDIVTSSLPPVALRFLPPFRAIGTRQDAAIDHPAL